MSYPESDAEVRIFRLWHANARRALPRRCYSNELHAHFVAICQTAYGAVGTVIDVYNASNGELRQQYARRVNGVQPMLKRRPPKGFHSILEDE